MRKISIATNHDAANYLQTYNTQFQTVNANTHFPLSDQEKCDTDLWSNTILLRLQLAEIEDAFILNTRKQTTLDGSSLKCKDSIISHVNGSRQYLSSSDSMKVKFLPSVKHWCWASSHASMTSMLILVSSILTEEKSYFLRKKGNECI